MEAFVSAARAVPILDAFERCGVPLSRLRRSGAEYTGPCPSCGGKDRFSLAPSKGVFNCRGAEGGDAIALAQHLTGEDFLDACEILTGEDRPDRVAADERERAQRRREAETRLAAQREAAAREDAKRVDESDAYRAKELGRCLDIWKAGRQGRGAGSSAFHYLQARGLSADMADAKYLRTHDRLGFFAKPERGPSIAIHYGPAMLALFVRPDGDRWEPIGLHQTWFDLDAGPKFRPSLAHPETGDALPSKKMRGSKAGGLIPVIGRISAASRMVAGEGIETALGFAAFDGFRADTFYCAAGDLGNLCGRATPESRIKHPTLRKTIKGGKTQVLKVPGFEPDMSSLCLPVPDHIDELVLLGDGDSEPVATRAALRRGESRHRKRDGMPDRVVRSIFAPPGSDWGDYRADEAEAA
jgi:hypothetical protein